MFSNDGDGGRQRRAPWLPVTTPLALAFLLLLVDSAAGQNLPNLEPLNGVVFSEIVTVRQQDVPSLTVSAQGFAGGLRGPGFAAAPARVSTDELRTVLRQGFAEAGRRRSVVLADQGRPQAAQPPPRPLRFRPQLPPGAAAAGGFAADTGAARPTTLTRVSTPGFLLFILRQPKEEVIRDACTGIAVNIAFDLIRDRFPLEVTNTPERVISNVFDTELCETLANEFCETTILPPSDCDPSSRYRTIDGTCNNLDNTDWGKSNRRMGRFHPPVYEDVIGMPRVTGISGNPLPNARDVSLALHHSPGNERESQISLFVMQWGQFLDHDLVHIPEAEKREGEPLDCCGVDRSDSRCFPIDTINPRDRVSRMHNRNCIQFARSITAPITSCQYIFREQSNQITSYIDGSQVYGSNEEERENLRGNWGKLRIFQESDPPFPTSDCPISASTQVLPATFNSNGFDFEAGDSRVTEQPGLASMHTLFLRVHNQIVDMLKRLNPYWDEDRLYEETRRIVGALLQHITYNEWLPIVLGPELMRRRGLASTGSYSQYDPSIDATIINSFGTAAFRFGHSLVAGTLIGEGQNLELGDNFFRGQSVCQRPTRTAALLRGLAASPANQYDSFLDPALTNLLFRDNEPIGLDLAALNIQRGRDHGLPGYNRWRELCFGQGFSSFDELRAANVMRPELVDRFRSLYASVDDIDLFSGGLSETHADGGLVGPVFGCILAEQFNKLKYGDRFFFEHAGQPGSFPPGQLNAIRGMNLASILCQFTDTQSLQPQAFFQNSLPGNQPRPCSQFPRLDLSQWVDTSTGTYGPSTTPRTDMYGPPTTPRTDMYGPPRRTNPPSTGHYGGGGRTPGASNLSVKRGRLVSQQMLPKQINIGSSPRLPFHIQRGVSAPYG